MVETLPRASRNIELKARCADLATARRAVESLGAREAGVQRQLDTYFHCAHGRLKLREIDGVRAELIAYARSDQAKSRASDYRLVPVSDASAIKAALGESLGIRGEVRKRREILLWHNVRIHLDQVDSLGTFIEFEAVMGNGEEETVAHARLAELCRAMSILPRDYLDRSYSDLMGI